MTQRKLFANVCVKCHKDWEFQPTRQGRARHPHRVFGH